jgi:hypothetical protein
MFFRPGLAQVPRPSRQHPWHRSPGLVEARAGAIESPVTKYEPSRWRLEPEPVEPSAMSALASPKRSMPRWLTVPQIITAREYSAQLVAAHRHAAQSCSDSRGNRSFSWASAAPRWNADPVLALRRLRVKGGCRHQLDDTAGLPSAPEMPYAFR